MRGVFGSVQHGVACVRIVAEIVEHPGFGLAAPAGRRCVGVAERRPVGTAIRGDDQRAPRRSPRELQHRYLKRPGAGGAGLLHGRSGDAFEPDHSGHPGKPVKAAELRIGRAENAEIDRVEGKCLRRKDSFRGLRRQPQTVKMRQRHLPFGEGSRPVNVIGNAGRAHSESRIKKPKHIKSAKTRATRLSKDEHVPIRR
ncbi:hypothetical protein GGD83_004621 [Rhodoblastus sphagnicola]|uniref:hypothetical protein n=1 Tax=Rhodoblastus sphagnicola TaxID=333368 RepID=UPI0011B0E895|nr:hypothetical protein [Rhodoblastus sphagnicola]MBB4200792.1 hypothetical protein [Rhodoblastus sphagnicola]